MRTPLLEVDALRILDQVRGATVERVASVSFAVARAEVLALVGESQSGHEVIGRAIIDGLRRPSRVAGGRIVMDGVDLRTGPASVRRQFLHARIATLAGDPRLILAPSRRIGAQVRSVLAADARPGRASVVERTRMLLARVGVPADDVVLNAYPAALPHDVRQRLGLALATARDPVLVIADDPAGEADVELRADRVNVLLHLCRSLGAALLWIGSDLALAGGFADRVGVMYAGRIIEEGSAADVVGDPAHPYARGLLDATPSRTPRGARLRTLPGATPAFAERRSGCPFRERCSRAIDACLGAPTLRTVGPLASGRTVLCHHPLPVRVAS